MDKRGVCSELNLCNLPSKDTSSCTSACHVVEIAQPRRRLLLRARVEGPAVIRELLDSLSICWQMTAQHEFQAYANNTSLLYIIEMSTDMHTVIHRIYIYIVYIIYRVYNIYIYHAHVYVCVQLYIRHASSIVCDIYTCMLYVVCNVAYAYII